jgi:hypothetical protein
VQKLAIEVSQLYTIAIDNPEVPHTGGREIVRRDRSQTAQPDDQDPCFSQLLLAFLTDFRQHHLPAVAVLLLFCQQEASPHD